MIAVKLVPKDRVEMVWPAVSDFVALSQARVSDNIGLDDLRGDLIRGGQQLWLVTKEDKLTAVIITMILQHPRRRIFRIAHIAGINAKDWLHDALAVMKDAAGKIGCEAIEAEGRPGWAKHAKKMNFRETHRVYEMELKHG